MSLDIVTQNTDFAQATSGLAALSFNVAYSFWFRRHGTSATQSVISASAAATTSLFAQAKFNGTEWFMYAYHFDGSSGGKFASNASNHPATDTWEHWLMEWTGMNTVARIWLSGVNQALSSDGSAGGSLGTIDLITIGKGIDTGKMALVGVYYGATTFTQDDVDKLAGTNIGGNNGANVGKPYSPELVHPTELAHCWSFDHATFGAAWLNDRVGSATQVLQGAATFDDASMPSNIFYGSAGGSSVIKKSIYYNLTGE